MKRNIVIISIILAISAITVSAINIVGKSDNNTTSQKLSVSNYTIKHSKEDIFEGSDLIVKAKVSRIKEKKNLTSNAKVSKESSETVSISAPCVIYNLDIVEVLDAEKSQFNKKKIDLITLDAKLDVEIQVGKEYIFCLKQDSEDENAYGIVNYEPGLYEVIDSETIASSITKEQTKIKNFKDEIEAFKKSKK